jgi:hypothetical protein
MARPVRLASILAVGVLLVAPSLTVAESDAVREIHGIARSAVTLHRAEVGPPADRPGGGGGGGGKPGGGGGLPGSTWHEANASLSMSNATYSGLPVNEPFVAAAPSGSTLIAGANDYRSGNGQGQAAVYRSTDGGRTWSGAFLALSTTWDDASSHGSGDPWLAFGTGDRAYYSAIYFDFNTNCAGGIYVVPASTSAALASTSPVLVSANGPSFEDKAAMAVLPGGGDGGADKVVVTWTRFTETSCTDTAYHDSKLYLATSTDGGASFGSPAVIPTLTDFNQGSFPVFAANGDLYVAYENWANATDVNGRIAVTRIPASGAAQTEQITAITDLASPLPGTKFRTNSFPAAAIAGGQLAITWASETGSGYSQIQLATQPLGDLASASWTIGRVDADPTGTTTALSVSASDRFFPAIAGHGASLGLVWLDRRDDGSNKKYRAWGAFYNCSSSGCSGGTNEPIASTLSDSSKDPFFRGTFIGDYIGAAYDSSGNFHPVWTDMRSKAPLPYRGNTQEIWTAYP